jgi:hypothetical protein
VRPGPYHFQVADSSLAAYRQILADLPRHNVTADQLKASLGRIKASCDQGVLPPGATGLGGAHYGISYHGYRFHFRVDEERMTISIIHIEDPTAGQTAVLPASPVT